jgi:tetratricopeptide (TPR) repeat protein
LRRAEDGYSLWIAFPGETWREPARALALEPRAPLTWGGLGDAYLGTKRFDEALDAFLKMVELQPDDGHAHHRMARALEAAGRLGEAEQAFERARQLGYAPR